MWKTYFVIFFSGICFIVGGEEPSYCRDVECTDDTQCTGTPCEHGRCEDAVCVCVGCWVGDSCDKPGNPHVPYFVSTLYEVTTQTDRPHESPLLQVEAEDGDQTLCVGQEDCGCGRIKYTILEGNDQGQFSIDPETGEIYAHSLVDIASGVSRRVYLTVGAENVGYEMYGRTVTRATVVVSIEGGPRTEYGGYKADFTQSGYTGGIPQVDYYGDMDGAPRVRRDLSAIPIGVSEVTFHLSKIGVNENVTSLKVGNKVRFQLAIQFPAGTTDILVELFTPDNDTTVMVLCGVEVVSVGSQLLVNGDTVAGADIGIEMEAKTEDSFDYDRAVVSLGNVTHEGASVSGPDEMVVIEWEVIMIAADGVENGSTYWVSAGAEYNSEENVWVGQGSFQVLLDDTLVPENPEFNFTGPEEVSMGSAVVFRVDMYIPFPSVDLTVDIFAPVNDTGVMSICNALIVDTGDHYTCLPKDKIQTTLYEASDNEKRNDRARMNIGTVTNADIHQEPFTQYMEKSRISIEFTIFVFDDVAYQNNSYWLGVAVEIGADLIWAAQLLVKVVDDDTLLGMPSDPLLKMTTLSDPTVVIGQTVQFELNVTIPQNSEALYVLDVLAPYNDSARMKICDVKIAAQGTNLPCFEETFPEFSSRDSSNVSDRGVWQLGRIRNTGQRDTALDPYADVLTLKIAAQILNHTLNQENDMIKLTCGLAIDSNKLWVGTNAMTISTAISTVSAPEYSVDYGFGTDEVPVGGAAEVILEITTKPDSIYSPMDLEFIMPYQNDSAVMRICRAEIVSNGANLPCFDRETVNSSVVYSSKNGDNVHDMAARSMGTVCNIKESDDNDTTEDKIVYSLVVELQDHESLEDGSKVWVSLGSTYSNQNLYLAQLAMFTSKGTPTSYAGPDEPYMSLERTDPLGVASPLDLTVGLPATYLLTLKPLPQARADFTVSVGAGAGLSVCVVRVVEAGRNLPCVDTTLEANYTQHPDSDYADTAVLSLGPVTNVAAEAIVLNDTFDNNTLTVEVVVMAFAAGSSTLEITVDYGPSSPGSPYNILSGTTLTATDLPSLMATQNDTEPSLNLTMVGVNENQTVTNEIAKGQTYLFHLDITPSPGSQHHMEVKFLTPVNQTAVMEICNVNLVYVGKNIPCLRRRDINAGSVYQSRNISGEPDHSYTDVASLDLGHVCHMTIDDEDPQSNLVRLEAVTKVTANNSLSAGEMIWQSATVRVNDDRILVTQFALKIMDTFEDTHTDLSGMANITLNTTSGALPMVPGEISDLFVHIQVPANTSVRAFMDVRLPFNETAAITVHHIQVVEAGENMGCVASNPDKEVVTQYNSTGDSTQNDYVVYDFGILTNSGVTYRTGTYADQDDVFVVLVQIQLTDALVNTHGSEHTVSVGLKLAETVFLVEKTVVVIRDGSEAPDFLLTANVSDTEIYTTSDDILIDALLKHTNESQAEGYNVTATFYFPSFMTFERLDKVNVTPPVVSDSDMGHGLQFTFESLFFTDIVAFTFVLRVNASYEIPLSESPLNATTPFEAGGNIIFRTGHMNESSTWFVAQVNSLSILVVGPGGIGCDSVPLSMQDGHIQDCQIEGSESPDQTRLPRHGRKGGTSAWTAGTRAGQFSRFMQVYFGNVTKVTDVTLVHEGGGAYSRVNDVQLMYSDDGINWDDYPTETLTADPGYSETTLTLSQSVEARYARLVLVDDQTTTLMPSLQVEFHGCTSTSDKTPQQVCSERSSSWLTQSPSPLLYSRSLLVAGSTQYFCDTVPPGDHLRCYSRAVGGLVTPLDGSVVTMLGHHGDTGELYGIAWDKRTVVTSEDNGETWMSVSQDRYDQAKTEVSWVPAADVPYVKGINVNEFSPVEAQYDGIYESSTQVTTWDTCC